jgi:hypothetical protein
MAVDLALGRIAEFDVEGDVGAVDLDVLDRFREETKSLLVFGSMTAARAALTSSAVMLMYFSNVMRKV